MELYNGSLPRLLLLAWGRHYRDKYLCVPQGGPNLTQEASADAIDAVIMLRALMDDDVDTGKSQGLGWFPPLEKA